MINASELRIGNWINIDNREKPRYRYRITAHDIEEIEGNGEDCFPIDLSPEILEACGFEKSEGDFFKDSVVYSNKIRLYQHDNNDYSLYGYNEQKVYLFYLHELQNIFYALTNTELEVNLNKEKV